ncbi:hypothetical protein V8C35DRAFT_317508 [Trichoderma chlorosporum]
MASGPAEEDDEISLLSTDDENGDELFVAEILAERHVNGEPHCLIRWKDLPLDQATWEPRENLTDELMGAWKQTRADQRNGSAPRFRIQDWKDAVTKSYEAKLARHNRRNIVRARRGHSQTTLSTMLEYVQELNVYSNEDEEGEEEDVHRIGPAPAEMELYQSLPDNPASSHADQSKITSSSSPITIEDSPSPQEPIREGLFGTPDESRAANPSEKPAVHHSAKLKSALKRSEARMRASVRFMLPPSEALPDELRRPSLSHRTAAARAPGYTNIFAGGRTRKGRGTLSEAAANPEINPKFLNSRLKRKIELQRRDREGIKAPNRRPSELISLDHNSLHDTSSEQPPANGSKDDNQPDGRRRSPTKGVAHWEDEPMEIDPRDSLFVSDRTPSPAPDDSDEEMTQPDTVSYDEQPQIQIVSKIVQLGPDRSNVATLSFDGIPHETGIAWTERFRSDERLIFTHMCTPQDFLCQTGGNGSLSITGLCDGTVLSYTENDFLKNLASNLRLGPLGLFCRNEDFCVYMFSPDKPESQPIQGHDATALKYQIFKPVNAQAPSILSGALQLIVADKSGERSAFWPRPMDQVFGQKYDQLLPAHERDVDRHNFFLAFPHRAEQEAFLLTKWLRDNRNDSDIRASYTGGSWTSFLKLAHGVIVIHEDMLWAIRKVPRLHDVLHGRRTHFTFWMFSRSLLPIHSVGAESSSVSPLGDIRLYRVFDPGAAFLITPSFLVSEPEHAYAFLKWFWNNYVKAFDMNRPRKLVLCAKVDEWIYNLYLEQLAMRDKHTASASKDELAAMGISDEAKECREKTFKLLQQLIADASDESSSIVLAPEAIDGNDEQSLVNWFGEWSILNMKDYRRYTVIGSGWQTESRLSRTLRAPVYEDNVISDPDEALSGVPSQTEPLTPPSVPRAIREDEHFSIKSRMYKIVEVFKKAFVPVRLYLYPVGYSTPDVAFQLGDITSKFYTYDQWFTFFWRVFTPTRKAGQNSYAGLFYTFDEHQASSRTFHDVQRSPWVAIFRPVNPHFKVPWESSELFIWDIKYSESIRRGKSFSYSDLRESQQRLIDYIQEKSQEKLPLKKVWVGAFGIKSGDATALDVTMQWLSGISTKVKEWIPASAKELPGRGWNPVTPDRPSGDRGSNSASEGDLEGNHRMEDDTSPRKIIFHPPPGHGQYQYTKCRNRLHQWARSLDPKHKGESSEYVFRPTIDWYNEQCEEGRGFEHIKVMPWKDVFEVYKIEEYLQRRS